MESIIIKGGKPLKGTLYSGDYEYEDLITQSRNSDDRYAAYNGRNCNFSDKEFEISSVLDSCLLVASKSAKTFFFAGNSHTDHYRELHYTLHKQKGINIFSVVILPNCLNIFNNRTLISKNYSF